MLVAQNFNREFLELWILKHQLSRKGTEQAMSRKGATSKLNSNDGFIFVNPPNETRCGNGETSSRDESSPSTSPIDVGPQASGGKSPSSSSSPSLDEFCQSFEHAMTIAQHAERAKAEARTAIDRAETARFLAEQAWDQAMSAAEAAQSIARSGLAVAKISLNACNSRTRSNHPTASLKSAFELFASQREPIMDFERFQQALCYDENSALGMDEEFVPAAEETESEYPCNMPNCSTCRNRHQAQSWRFFKVPQEFTSPPKTRNQIPGCRQPAPPKTKTVPPAILKRAENAPKPSGVPKCFEKYSSPLGQFSATSPRMTKAPNRRSGNESIKPVANHIAERFLQLNTGPMPARQSASDELEYLTFWPPNESQKLEDPFQCDDEASSDEGSRSPPVFWGVRTRRAESCEEGLLNSPLKPRQLQRLSDMEPTEELAKARLHQVTSARRSQSCSSEPGADPVKRPCSPLVLPDVDSGTNVQILPNNVQAFQPPPSKSTTPPTSRHGHVTSSTKAYLSD